jgi:hypothetical protein
VSDIFREVEEDVRRERLEQIWKKYSDYIIAGMALIVLAAAGVQLYRVYEQREANKASEEFVAAEQALENGQARAAAEMFGRIAQTAPSGYAAVAKLAGADALFESGNHAEAIQIEKQIAASGDPILAAAARIHTAWSIVDTAPKSEIETLLAPLTDPANAWHYMAREILAYADVRAGDTADGLKEFQSLTADANAPSSLRARTNAMAIYLKSGAGANFGTVPRPPQPQATPLGPAGGPSAQ